MCGRAQLGQCNSEMGAEAVMRGLSLCRDVGVGCSL